MESEYIIPAGKDDVLVGELGYKAAGASRASLENDLEDIAERIAENGPMVILESGVYDMLCGIASYYSEVESGPKRLCWDILVSVAAQLCDVVNRTFESLPQGENVDGETSRHLRSALKMNAFLLNWVMSQMEAEENANSRAEALSGAGDTDGKGKGKKGAKKTNKGADRGWEWSVQKEKAVSTMNALAQSEMARLWDMACVEEAFVTLFSRSAYMLLESAGNLKNKTIRDGVFHLLGALVQRYNHAMATVTSVVHLLPLFEHLSQPFAQMLGVFAHEYECATIATEVMREIGRMSAADLARDASGAKYIASFLVELANVLPETVLIGIDSVIAHLDGESYTIRNAVLEVLGRLISKCLVKSATDESRALRDTYFDLLFERLLDTNAFVRSKALQVWQALAEERAIPLVRRRPLTDAAIVRLSDKASVVRKSSIQLIGTLMRCNPYGSELRLSVLKKKLEEESKTLQALVDAPDAAVVSAVDGDAPADAASAATDGVARQRTVVRYFEDAMRFTEQLDSAVPLLCQLLGSTAQSDACEAIEFFVEARSFGLETASDGVRKMLSLVWAREQSVKDAVISAYSRMIVPADDGTGKIASPAAIARNLIDMTHGATLGDLTSLEELVVEFVARGIVQPAVFRCLWDVFSGKVAQATKAQMRGSLSVLIMASAGEPDIMRGNIASIVACGLGQESDWDTRRLACVALQRMVGTSGPGRSKRAAAPVQPSSSSQGQPATPAVDMRRLPMADPLFVRLCELVVAEAADAGNAWFGFCEQAIGAIYALAEGPDVLCEGVLRSLSARVFGSSTSKGQTCMSTSLSRLIFAVGHVSLKQLVHLDAVQSELKRRREAEATQAASESKARASRKSVGGHGSSSIEDELGMAAAADDAETEAIMRCCEALVAAEANNGLGFLAAYAPLVTKVCVDQKTYADGHLRASAALALCKMMCVSSRFCEANLRLLFTVLKQSPEPAVRSNIVISLGDLAFRHPNLVEPWTPHVYARLRDRDERVRKNALMVLTHLVLNDMIKIKGQIGAMACCLEDPSQRIADLSRLFFHELAKKGNTIYNVLPDVISQLTSDSASRVDSAAFRRIATYLFSFMQKERQGEALVEKLCHRLRATRDTQQARDIAHCVTLLGLGDKGVRRLLDLFPCIADRLTDDDIRGSFLATVAKARKFAKPETKAVLDEIESRIQRKARGDVDGEGASGADADQTSAALDVTAGGTGGGSAGLDLGSDEDANVMARPESKPAVAAAGVSGAGKGGSATAKPLSGAGGRKAVAARGAKAAPAKKKGGKAPARGKAATADSEDASDSDPSVVDELDTGSDDADDAVENRDPKRNAPAPAARRGASATTAKGAAAGRRRVQRRVVSDSGDDVDF